MEAERSSLLTASFVRVWLATLWRLRLVRNGRARAAALHEGRARSRLVRRRGRDGRGEPDLDRPLDAFRAVRGPARTAPAPARRRRGDGRLLPRARADSRADGDHRHPPGCRRGRGDVRRRRVHGDRGHRSRGPPRRGDEPRHARLVPRADVRPRRRRPRSRRPPLHGRLARLGRARPRLDRADRDLPRDEAAVRADGLARLAAAARRSASGAARPGRPARLRGLRDLRGALCPRSRDRPARPRLRALRRGHLHRPRLRPQAAGCPGRPAHARALLRHPRGGACHDRRLAVDNGPARGNGRLRSRPGAHVSLRRAARDGGDDHGRAERDGRHRRRVRGRGDRPRRVHARRRRLGLGLRRRMFLVASLVALTGLFVLAPLWQSGRIPAEEGVP